MPVSSLIKTLYFWGIKVILESCWERLGLLLIKENLKAYSVRNKLKLLMNLTNPNHLRENSLKKTSCTYFIDKVKKNILKTLISKRTMMAFSLLIILVVSNSVENPSITGQRTMFLLLIPDIDLDQDPSFKDWTYLIFDQFQSIYKTIPMIEEEKVKHKNVLNQKIQ